MRADYHMHTSFSKDSDASPEEMIKEAIRRGLTSICITDHQDMDYSEPGFEIDFPRYFEELLALQKKYQEKLDIRIGTELGLQAHLQEQNAQVTKVYPFDFVIGSLHLVDGIDPYYGTFFEGKTDEAGCRRFLELTWENVKQADYIDVLGHLDYIVRFAKDPKHTYRPAEYADLLDMILKYLIEHGKGLEVNTAGYKYGLSFAHPHPDILKRYRELGGEIITIGSDGHRPEHLAYDFHKVREVLVSCGFKYYTEFRQRSPIFCALV